MSPFPQIAACLIALVSIEASAYWWMHPAPAGQSDPVLIYRPTGSAGVPLANQETGAKGQESVDGSQALQGTNLDNRVERSSFTRQLLPKIVTPLPDIYRKAAPMLRCSSGQTFRVDTSDSLTLHLAFFEWDGTDTGSVLEAFRHMPEACLGSIGMKLISKEKPIRYNVKSQESEAKSQESKGSNHQANRVEQSSFSRRDTDHSSSSSPNTLLLFDHTVFHDVDASHSILPRSVHSFRAVWVSGMDAADARTGIDGKDLAQLRTIRLKAAATRYSPPRACVIQGAVRGAPNATAAWQIFEQTMLNDLHFEPSR